MIKGKQDGLTLLEILLVIGILAILFVLVFVSVRSATKRSHDIRIRSDVRQMRLLAEEVFDHAGASYMDWTNNPLVVSQVATLRADIAKPHGDEANPTLYSVIISNRETEYCVSAKLVAGNEGPFTCVDASGVFKFTSTQCVDPGDPEVPLGCP